MADMTSDDVQKILDKLDSINRSVLKQTSTTEKIAKEEKRTAGKTTASTSGSHNTNSSLSSGDQAVIKRMLGEQSKLAGAFSNLTGKLTAANNAAGSMAGGFQKFSAASSSATKSINAFMSPLTKIFGAGGAIKLMADAMGQTTDVYRDMMQVGQNFNGSMLQMQIAAADAALPLEEFGKIVGKFSTEMSVIGTKSFGDMSKQLRVSLKDVGQLGLTTSQLNQNLGAYLNTQRLYGNLSNQTTEKTVANMRSLGIETLKAAQLTGMNSAAITEASNKAMQDETLRAKMLQMNASSVDSYSTTMNKAMVYMAALPGEAGKTMASMLAQTAGRGSALMTDQAQVFIDAGMFGVTDMMDNMSKKIANGTWNDQDAAEFNRKFVAEGKKNLASLQMQAAAGNDNAKKVINMISEMEEVSKKTPEELQKQKGITNFLLNLGSIIERVSGLIRERFYKGLESLMTKFEGFTDSPAFTAFSDKIGDMAERFGNFLSETLTPEKLIAIGGGLASFAEFLVKVGSVGLEVVSKAASVFGWLSDKMGVFGAALVTWAAWKGAKALGGAAMGAAGGAVGRVKNLLGERFNIGFLKDKIDPNGKLTPGGVQNAFEQALSKFAQNGAIRVVQLGGGGGGGGLDDLDLDHDEKKKKGRRNRRGRRGGRGRARLNTPRAPHVEMPHHGPELHADRGHALSERHTVRGAGHPNAPHPNAPHPNAPHPNVPHPNVPHPHAPHIEPHSINNQRFHLPEHHDTSIANRLKGVAGRGWQMSKSAVVSGLQYGKAGALRAGSLAKTAVTRGAHYGRAGLSKGASLGKSAVTHGLQYGRTGLSKAASLGRTGLSKAGSLLGKGAKAGGSLLKGVGGSTLLKGGMGLAKGLAGGAIGGLAVEGIKAITPDFKGKDTMAAMAQGAMMGATFGPIGMAIGAGAGALIENWDSVTEVAGNAFKSIKDFDYAGTMKTAGKYLAPIGGALTFGSSLIFDHWDDISGAVSNSFNAIANFDYSGALGKVGNALGPIKGAVKGFAKMWMAPWKKIGSFAMGAMSSIKNFFSDNNDDKQKAATDTIAQSADTKQQSIAENWSKLTQTTDLTSPVSDKFNSFLNGNTLGVANMNLSNLPGTNAPMSLAPNTGVDMFGNPLQGPALVAPKNPAGMETPKLNTDHLAAHGAGWKEHSLQLQKDNLDTKKQLAQLMETLANGNNQTVGGLRDMINEQQKSNRNLDVIGGSII